MDQSFVQSNVAEVLDPSQEIVEEIVEIVEQVAPASPTLPSYHPTSWALLNTVLDRVDVITNGRAGSLYQFATFLVFGGSTALVNMAIVYVVFYRMQMPALTSQVHNLIAIALGCEISLTCNFFLNDNVTFKHMPGRSRSLLGRFWRFQTTGIVGTILTILIESAFSDFLHLPALVSTAIAIVIVLFYNFFMQSFFTYSKNKQVKVAA